MVTREKVIVPKKAKPGVIIRIPIKQDLCTYGQLLEKGCLAIFDYFDNGVNLPDFHMLTHSKIIFSPTIFETVKTRVINKGKWPIVGFAEPSNTVINQIQPRYHLNEGNSALLFYSGTEIEDVDPESMYGLLPISVFNEHNILNFLQAYINDRYSNSEILSMLHVYFRGSIPHDFRIPENYFNWSRSKPLPKPNEI